MELSLKYISHRLAMLLAFTSGQQCQILHAIDLEDCSFVSDTLKFVISTVLKTSKVGCDQPTITLEPFYEELNIHTCMCNQ